jgi:hypothetical protein
MEEVLFAMEEDDKEVRTYLYIDNSDMLKERPFYIGL